MADSEVTERSESSEKSGEDEETKVSIAELLENMWTAVETGKDKELRKFFSQHEERDIPLNRDNEEFDEDGGHILIFCVKEGCSRGNSFGRDFVQCVRILLTYENLDIDVQDKSERTALHWAVLGKNTQFTSLLMKAGADPTIHDHDGLSPFHIAVQKGYKELLKILASNQDKEIFSKKDGKGTPPLVTAVNSGNLEICRYLLENGAKIDATDRRLKRSALQYAILAKNLDIFDLLLKYNPSLDQGDYRGKTALHRICAIKDPRYFQRVIKHYGTFPDHIMEQETDDGVTPVISACQSGNSQQLKELIDQGAPISTKDDNGRTALHYCADNLETQCAEMLLAKDPSLLEVKDSQGFTPLHMSVISGNVPLLKLLLAKGADIRSLDSELHTPTHWATGSFCGHLEILDILIDNGAELSSADSHNAYPIHYAAQMNGKDSNHADTKVGEKVLKKLLDSGVPHDVTDKDGRQPLLWAASAGNTESIKLLVKAGADVNAIDKDGLSALHCAASRGHSHCIEELKKLGADVNLADKNSCTPLFYAVTLGNKDCTKTLLKHGADPNHQDVRGRTPSHCASVKGCVETLKILDKSKADLWGCSGRGDFPLHEAAQGGHCDVVKYLLKWKNAPDAVNTPNNAGRTCLHIAAIINNLPLCKLLLDNGAEKNSLMMHKDKSYTPYDAAILKDNRETAEYIKSKGGNTGGDIDNILNKKDKRESKSAKSRKSNLESHKEEEENAEQDKKSEKQDEADKEEKPKSKKELEKEKKEAEKAKKEEEKKKKEEELKTKKEEEKKKKEEEKKQKEEEKKKKEEEKKQIEEEKKQKEEEKKQKEQESKTSTEETTDKKEETVVAAAAAVVADEKEKKKEEDKKGKKDGSKEEKNSKEGKGSKEVKDSKEKEQEKKNKEQKDPEKEDQLESDEEVVVVKGKKVVRKKKGYVKDKEAEKARKESEEAKKDAVKANQEAEKAKANAEKAKLEKEQQDQKRKKSAKEKKEEKVESNKAKDKEKTQKDEKAVASGALAAKNRKGKKDPDTIQEEDEEEEDDTIKESPIEAEKAKRETEKSQKEAEKLRKEAEEANSEAEKIKQAAVVAGAAEESKDTSKKKEQQTEKGGKGKGDKAPKTPSKGKKDSSGKEEISKDQKGKKDTKKTDTKPEESQKDKSTPATPKTPKKDVKEPDKDEEPEVKEKDKKEQDKNSSKDKKDKQDTKDLEKVEKSTPKEEKESESKNKEKKEKEDTKDLEKVDKSAHKEEKESESKNKKDNTDKPGTDKKSKDTKDDKSELQKEKSTVSKRDKSKQSSEQPVVDKEKTSSDLKEDDKKQKKNSQSKSESEEKSNKKISEKNKSEDKNQEKPLGKPKLEEKDKKSSEKSKVQDKPQRKTPEKKQREEKTPRKTSGKLQQENEDHKQTSENQILEENLNEDKVGAGDEIDEREDSGVNTPGSLAEEEDLEKHLVAANIAAEKEKKKNKSTNQPGPSTSTPKTKHRPKKEDNHKQKVSRKDSGKPISRERTEFQEVELRTNRDSGNHSQSEDRHSQTEDRHSQTEDRHSQTEGRQSQTKQNLVLSPSLSPVDYQEHSPHQKDAFVQTPKSRSAHTEKQDDDDEFEFPENSHENQEAALRLAESRRQSRQETVPESSRTSDSPDRESRSRRKASKIPDTEVIQPGLKSRDNSRSKTPVLTNGHTQQNKDYVDTSEEDDDVITEINFQNRLRRIEKAQLARNKQKEQYLLQQLRKTQKPNYKLVPVRSKNKSNLSLADMERLDTSGRRRNVPRRVASIQESVRRYQDQRRFVRQMHQLKRAQIYTGPMHDIVLFSKMMDVYKHSTPGGSENDLEMSTMDNWDSYLRDQLRFVSHYYDEDKSVRDQTNKVRRETAETRRGVESRSEYLAQSFKRKEEQDGREKTDLDGRISTLTRKTEDIYDSVKEKADQTLQDAKETNASLDKYYRKERSELLHHSRPHSYKKLKDEEEMDERHRLHEEHEKARKEKHSEWHRKKDEELRRRLLKVYGNGSEIMYGKSRNVGHVKSSTPRTNSVGNSPGSRPKSMMSSISGSRAQYSNSTDQELSVQMTEFGFRRVKKTDDGSYVPCSRHGSNWTPKFDGDVRPRAGLVFVEPKLYNEYLKEEAQVRHQTAMMARSRSTNINTLEDDATVLETVES